LTLIVYIVIIYVTINYGQSVVKGAS